MTMAIRQNYYQLVLVYFLALLVVVSLADDPENDTGGRKKIRKCIDGHHLRISASQVTKTFLFSYISFYIIFTLNVYVDTTIHDLPFGTRWEIRLQWHPG